MESLLYNRGLLYNGDGDLKGAQTVRRFGAGPVGSLLGRKDPTGRFFSTIGLELGGCPCLTYQCEKMGGIAREKAEKHKRPYSPPSKERRGAGRVDFLFARWQGQDGFMISEPIKADARRAVTIPA